MRAVVQRVNNASVTVDGRTIGSIGRGFLVLLGVHVSDTEKDADYIAKKISGLRVFEDPDGKMNLSLNDANGELLVVSQFTLYGDARHGNRPSFIEAALPDTAIPLYEYVVSKLRESFHVETGEFGADMKVSLVNDGPVTILLDSKKSF
ncbi:MAG: D-tyrosyl-tRNA(Tyr) deacylase [Clostridiales bacterium]|nr:D-tyrosyl-tRNA(Tyr) deacylase [Clostridiales bacterium]